MERPKMILAGTVLDSLNARSLATFYEQFLGWKRTQDQEGWVVLTPPDGGTRLSFQTEPEYVRPVWPSTKSNQQMSIHLDIATDDIDASVALAVELGATMADWQPQSGVTVMLDPAGHPFCLFYWVDG
jgi:predicted enzyme related to lactoylglutathione lyase